MEKFKDRSHCFKEIVRWIVKLIKIEFFEIYRYYINIKFPKIKNIYDWLYIIARFNWLQISKNFEYFNISRIQKSLIEILITAIPSITLYIFT